MDNKLLLQITKTYGSPTYVYDAEKIISQYQQLNNAFKPIDVKLFYAIKALSNTNILRLLLHQGAGLDAVSIEEVQLGLRAGFSPSKIMYTPNCVAFSEIKKQ